MYCIVYRTTKYCFVITFLDLFLILIEYFHISVLLKKPQSQICRVSPLHGLEYTAVKLKQYALKIKQFLANNIKTATNVKYSAEICIIDNLKLEVSHDDALKVCKILY